MWSVHAKVTSRILCLPFKLNGSYEVVKVFFRHQNYENYELILMDVDNLLGIELKLENFYTFVYFENM